MSDTGELVIICASLIGAGLGFLWFNAPPAMVFMGDTGSLSMGGTIGAQLWQQNITNFDNYRWNSCFRGIISFCTGYFI